MNRKKVINFIKKINPIKKRELKTKNNRIYLQDSELTKTAFEPGKKYSYQFVNKNKSILKIYIDTNGTRTVSKRKRKNYINPIIDIRTTKVLEEFSKFDKLEVEIYEDDILIKGLSEDKTVDANYSNTQYIDNVVYVKDNKKVKIKEVLIPKKTVHELYMKKCANGDKFEFTGEQITIDSLLEQINNKNVSISTKYNVKSKELLNKDIGKALEVVSLCSGAGVLDKGFKDQGFKLKFALDIEKDMVETYKANLGEHAIQGDLSNLDINIIPDGDILIAGTPCQDFVRQ